MNITLSAAPRIMSDKQLEYIIKLQSRLIPRNEGKEETPHALIETLSQNRDRVTTRIASKVISYLKDCYFHPPVSGYELDLEHEAEERLIAEIIAI